MEGVDFRPKPEDTSISIPVTFDYKGGRSSNLKNKILLALAIVFITIASIAILCIGDLELYLKIALPIPILYAGLFLMRFLVFNERRYSDIYETLIENDFTLDVSNIWQIFDIDYQYPYICYFKNGYKGIFVRMEKDAVTGKPDTEMYDHYEAIGDAYNVAHSLNMNIVHIDYMDNVGNDVRMQKLYDDLDKVDNPDMQEMLIDIYDNLQDEMSHNYASFDIYLFLTRDNVQNFVYNMQTVCSRMLGGNFITYKVLDRYELSRVCVALMNLHEFSVVDACEKVLANEVSSGIIPICVMHSDGTREELNKTVAEKQAIARENQRKATEAAEQKKKQKRKKNGNSELEEKKPDNVEIDLFN